MSAAPTSETSDVSVATDDVADPTATDRVLPRVVAAWFVLVSTVVAFYFDGPNFSARLGPIDDHEAVRWQNAGSGVSPAGFWQLLMTTEVGHPGDTARYRPAYYAARILEAWAFGSNAGAWYVERTVLQVLVVAMLGLVALAVVGRAAHRVTGPGTGAQLGYVLPMLLLAGVWAVVLVGLEYWNDTVTRLGPTELIASVGLGIFVWGGYGLLVWRSRGYWLLFAAGFAVAALSKENMPILLLPAVIIAADRARRTRERWEAVTSLASMVVVTVGIYAAVLPVLRATATDVYGRSVGTGRLGAALDYWRATPDLMTHTMLYLLVVVVGFVVLVGRRRTMSLMTLQALALSIPVMMLADSVFYTGNYDQARYLMMMNVLTFAEVVVVVALATALIWEWRREWRPWSVAIVAAVAIVVSMPGFTASLDSLPARYEYAQANRAATAAFQDKIDEIVGLYEDDPRTQFLMQIGDSAYMEYPYSFSQYLYQRGIPQSQLFVVLSRSSTAPPSRLDTVVRNASEFGDAAWRTSPIGSFDPAGPRVCLNLGAPPYGDDPRCMDQPSTTYP